MTGARPIPTRILPAWTRSATRASGACWASGVSMATGENPSTKVSDNVKAARCTGALPLVRVDRRGPVVLPRALGRLDVDALEHRQECQRAAEEQEEDPEVVGE